MPTLHVNGANLYYEVHGTGAETIVFGHSLLFSGRMFDAQVQALKDRYRCVTFDFRGQGRSAVTPDGYDIDTLSTDAAKLIEILGCVPCHFVGFSMGGFVGLRLAIRRPDLMTSLALIDTSADAEPRENLAKYRLMTMVARWLGLWAVVRSVTPIMFGETFLRDPDRAELRKTWRQQLMANHRIGITRAVKGVMARQGVLDAIETISVPTLIVVGEQDVATPPEKSEQMQTRIPQSRLVRIPNAGHMSPVEEPEAVNAALEAFLSSLS